ncbi:MAG: iron-sulfur cluster assembly scaffold protein [Pseudomonadota bacterium]
MDEHTHRPAGSLEGRLGEGGLSDEFLTHGLTPANLGLLPKPDAFAQTPPTNGCHDVIELYAYVQGGVVSDIRFMTEGCLHTVACASALTSLIKGQPLAEASGLTSEQVAAELGGLDPAHFHCAELAVATWRFAVADYHHKQRAPWTKDYQRR